MKSRWGQGRSSRGGWKNFLLLLSSLCVALVLAEVLTRLFVPVRDVGALFTVNDPVMGKRIKKNFHTVRVTPEFTMTFSSNSLGFRGPEPASPPTDSVLFIGDSFTMGYGVSDGEEYPALIRAKLDATFGKNTVSVVNTGMGNNGNGRWIKLLRAEAAQYNPRLVVLQVSANDFADNVREAYFSLSDSGTLNELPIKVSKARSLEAFVDGITGLSRSHFYSLIRQTLGQLLPDAGAVKTVTKQDDAVTNQDHDYAYRLTERLITEALLICQEKGYAVFVILVGLEGNSLNRLQTMLQSRQVPAFSAPDKTERPDLYFKIDGHWNAAGHALVARAVFDQLLSLNLIQEHASGMGGR